MNRSGLLTVDVLTAAYLAATAIIALISRTETGLWLALFHLLGIGVVFGLGRLPRPRGTLGAVLRIAYPVAVTPLFYMELATLNQLLFPGYFDPAVQAWEEAVFGVQLSVKASEWIPYRWFSEILHLGYVSYYLVVPTNTSQEGSYGRDSAGTIRPTSGTPCRPQQIVPCFDSGGL